MSFDPKKHLIRVQGGREYLPVAYRLVWFREEHPEWGIKTNLVQLDVDKGVAVWHAEVTDEAGRVLSSGTKMETARGFADFIEKAETGAIGRALGVLGYGTQFAPDMDEGDHLVDSPVPPHAAEGRGGAPCYCAECGKPLTAGQCSYSTKRFEKPLCPSHQATALKDGIKGALNDFGKAQKEKA